MFVNSTLWSVNSQETSKIGASYCLQISDFKAKMHQIHVLLGLRLRPRWGSLQCPRPLPLFKGPTSKGMERNGRAGRKGKGEETFKKGDRWREGIGPPTNFGVAPPMIHSMQCIRVSKHIHPAAGSRHFTRHHCHARAFLFRSQTAKDIPSVVNGR